MTTDSEAGGPVIWARVRKAIRAKLGADTFDKWISSLTFVAEVNGEIVLAAASVVVSERIKRDYLRVIERIWTSQDPRSRGVKVESVSDLPSHMRALVVESADRASAVVVDMFEGVGVSETKAAPDESSDDLTGDDGFVQSFETLVVGESNQLAATVAEKLVNDRALPVPVVLFYGAHGVGKTHIMRAIERAKMKRSGEKSVVYMSAEDFMLTFVEGVKKKDTSAQRKRIRKASIVLLDDLQFITSRKGTLKEFFLHLRAVTENGGKVVLSSDAAPTRLESLDNRMRDEIQGGVVVEIHRPELDMRANIVRSKVDIIARDFPEFKLKDEWIEMIAAALPASGRALYGAVRNVFAGTVLADKPVTVSAIEAAIRLQVGEKRPPRLETIKDVVAKFYGLTKADLESEVRRRTLARPRQIAMYFSRKLTSCSYPQIGWSFGKRDHTTVIYGYRQVSKRLKAEPDFPAEMARLEQMILDDARNCDAA